MKPTITLLLLAVFTIEQYGRLEISFLLQRHYCMKNFIDECFVVV